MEWLNYHHLRYFWAVAHEGNLRKAAQKLHVSQPSISTQVKELEEMLGEPLFRRSGRSNVLTEAGQIALRYADEIFALGTEMMKAIKQQPGAKMLRLYVGIVDSVPKLATNEILKPVLAMGRAVQMICREGKPEDLLAQLSAHQLDIVLADEAAPSNLQFRTYNHLLGESGVSFCAAGKLAQALRKDFPGSLNEAPALLPAENTAMRRSLEAWFRTNRITPQIIAEFEDAALMQVMAAEGKGFMPISTVVLHEALTRYRLQVIGASESCRVQFYAITAERRIRHPAVALITEKAASLLRGQAPSR